MKKFYVFKGGLAKGPFTIEKLVENGIDQSDPVWCAGFTECKPAIRVKELQMIFKSRQHQAAADFALVPRQHHYVLYKKPQSKYNVLFVCSLVAATALIIFYTVTVLAS